MNIKIIKRPIHFLLIITLLIINTACHYNTKYSVIDEVNRYMSSEELQGRCEGSSGNIKAQSFIEGIFKDIKLGFLNEKTYLIPYNHEILDSDNSVIELSVNFTNTGEVRNLVYGTDFLPRNYISGTNINCSITSDINDSEINGKALLIKNDMELLQPEEGLKAILIKTSLFKKNINAFEKSSTSIPLIQIADNVFEELVNSNAIISYKIDISKRQTTSNNVVGVIPGKDRSKALIISAHFDHLGTAGKLIFPGAYDNASGTAIMISLARRLKAHAEKSPLPYDIIFCSFNSEESGLKGSKAFVDRLDEHNVINNINLDCLGMKNNGDMQIILSQLTGGRELAEDFKKFAEGYGYKVDFNNLISDYESFDVKGFPAISIGQEKTDFMHTPNDNIDKLDISKQQKYSDLLFNYIIKKYKPFNSHKHSNDNAEEEFTPFTPFEKRIDDEMKNMWFNQFKNIELTNDNNEKVSIDIRGGKYNTEDIIDANNFLKSTNVVLKAVSQLDLYEFKKMNIGITSNPANFPSNLDKDKIYTVEDLELESMNYIEIEYQAKDDDLHTISLHISPKNQMESVNEYINVKMGETEYTIYYTKGGFIIGAALKVQNNNKPYYINFSKSYENGDKIIIDWEDEKEVEHYVNLWIAGQENG